MERRDRQERPLTLGELLFMENPREPTRAPQHRPMGRTMSPTRCLGALASGRRRRPRGRTLARPTTSTNQDENSSNESTQNRQSQNRSGHHPPLGLFIDGFLPLRNAAPESRTRNFWLVMNATRRNRRRATSDHHGATRLINSLLHPHPSSNSMQRRHSVGGYSRSRTSANADIISNIRRLLSSNTRSSRGASRTNDVYDGRMIRTTSTYHYLLAGSPRSSREPRGNSTNGSSRTEPVVLDQRVIDFAAEFIPMRERLFNINTPEWFRDVSVSQFGSFAPLTRVLSSLASMGILSQETEAQVNNAQPATNEN